MVRCVKHRGAMLDGCCDAALTTDALLPHRDVSVADVRRVCRTLLSHAYIAATLMCALSPQRS
eukprot:3931374-Rhodomonas_salina.1